MRFFGLLYFISCLGFGQNFESVKPKNTFKKDNIEVNSYDFDELSKILNFDDGNTYVVNFWATWCLPCVKELPYFEQINAEFKTKNVKVILVSLDMTKQIESQLIPFIIKKKLNSNIVHLDDPDANSWIDKVDKDWSGAIPATLIYTKGKRVFFEKSFTYDELKNEITEFLKSKS